MLPLSVYWIGMQNALFRYVFDSILGYYKNVSCFSTVKFRMKIMKHSAYKRKWWNSNEKEIASKNLLHQNLKYMSKCLQFYSANSSINSKSFEPHFTQNAECTVVVVESRIHVTEFVQMLSNFFFKSTFEECQICENSIVSFPLSVAFCFGIFRNGRQKRIHYINYWQIRPTRHLNYVYKLS